jgi:hypothetical protein
MNLAGDEDDETDREGGEEEEKKYVFPPGFAFLLGAWLIPIFVLSTAPTSGYQSTNSSPLRPHERVCVSVREWEEEKEEEGGGDACGCGAISPLQPGDANAAPQSGPARGSAAEGGNPDGGARVPVAIWVTWASPSWWVRRYDVLLETARSTRGTLCCSSFVISRFFPFSFFPCLMHSRIQNMRLHLTCYSYYFLPRLMYDLVQIHIKFHLQKILSS